MAEWIKISFSLSNARTCAHIHVHTHANTHTHTHTHTHTEEYYPATRQSEMLLFVKTWLVLEDIMLNEISQTKAILYSLIYMWNHKKPKLIKTQTTHHHSFNRLSQRLEGGGNGKMLVKGYKLPVIRQTILGI